MATDPTVATDRKAYELWLKFDIANPAPDPNKLNPPEDRHPWTAAEDSILRVQVAKFEQLEPKPWKQIAHLCYAEFKGQFGHNDGSCAKRWGELPALKTDKVDVFCFKPGGECTSYKKQPFAAA